MQALPPEIWIGIIGGLPSRYQRSCLSVSKLFRSISLQYLFASVTVRLGIARDFYLADEDRWCPQNDSEKAGADAAMNRSCDLLRYVVHSPLSGLAAAVKNVSVRAYSYYGESPPPDLLGTFFLVPLLNFSQ